MSDFGCGRGGETRASPQRAVTVEPTKAPAKRTIEHLHRILKQALSLDRPAPAYGKLDLRRKSVSYRKETK
jgi:hypothetical protein